jgi:hypothetical protein
VIAGPRAEEIGPVEIDHLASLIDSIGQRLSSAWRAATLGGTSGAAGPADALQAARSEHVA